MIFIYIYITLIEIKQFIIILIFRLAIIKILKIFPGDWKGIEIELKLY